MLFIANQCNIFLYAIWSDLLLIYSLGWSIFIQYIYEVTKPLKPEANQSQHEWKLNMQDSPFSNGQWITHAHLSYEMGDLIRESGAVLLRHLPES